jgi:hypothetical protein
VLLNKVRLERTRQFGACWLGLELWKRLALDRFFEEARRRRRLLWGHPLADVEGR